MWTWLRSRPKRIRAHLTGTARDKEPIEEETVVTQPRSAWYPVVVGETFQDQYKVLGKLGFGTNSTVWLCRDDVRQDYKVLKMCVRERTPESPEYMASMAVHRIDTNHLGKRHLCSPSGTFRITGASGQHHRAFIMSPAACSLMALGNHGPLDLTMIKAVIRAVLFALDFLHTEVHIVHTDVKPSNVLFQLTDRQVLKDFERSQEETPPKPKPGGSRKNGNLVYRSRQLKSFELGTSSLGAPMLSDLGSAHLFGDQVDHRPSVPGPLDLRSPECILGMRWSYPVDI